MKISTSCWYCVDSLFSVVGARVKTIYIQRWFHERQAFRGGAGRDPNDVSLCARLSQEPRVSVFGGST